MCAIANCSATGVWCLCRTIGSVASTASALTFAKYKWSTPTLPPLSTRRCRGESKTGTASQILTFFAFSLTCSNASATYKPIPFCIFLAAWRWSSMTEMIVLMIVIALEVKRECGLFRIYKWLYTHKTMQTIASIITARPSAITAVYSPINKIISLPRWPAHTQTQTWKESRNWTS